MELAIIGTGDVGRTLGREFADAGHAVTFGSRTPDDPEIEDLVDELGDSAEVTTQGDAARAGEVVILAVPGDVAPDAAADLADPIGEKPILDATNAMERTDEALAQQVANEVPNASVAKVFNTIGTEGMADPSFPDGDATMFVAGDDDAKSIALDLAEDLGFEPLDAGDLSDALMLEDLARFWIHLSGEYGRYIAFSLLEE